MIWGGICIIMSNIVIGICDDQEVIIEQLRDHITSIMNEIWNDEWSLCEYVSPLELLKEVEKIDVLFLDIEMPEMDGIEVGKKVMKINPDCKVVVATSRTDRFKEAFVIEASRFVTKPFYIGEIKEALQSLLVRKIGENEIEVFRDRINFMIKEKDITMVRAYNGYVEVIAGNSVFRKDVSLNVLEQHLDERLFLRINRQYLINLGYVDHYNKTSLMVGDMKFSIAVRRQKEFLNKYTKYDLNYR